MARNFDGIGDYMQAASAYLSASTGPFVVGGYWKPASLGGSAGYVLSSGDTAGNHWRVSWESTADSLTFHKSGGSGTDPSTSSAIALTSADLSRGVRWAYRYSGQSGEWSKWVSRGDGGRATVTKTVISASISFTLPTLSTALTYLSAPSALVEGVMSDVYIVAADLTDEQMQMLLRGVSATQVTKCAAYWPLRGYNSPEMDYSARPAVSGGAPMSLGSGAVCDIATHPQSIGRDELLSPSQLYSWALIIQQPNAYTYSASADLGDVYDLDTLGAAYAKRIVNSEGIEVSRSLTDGIGTLRSPVTVILRKDARLGFATSYASTVFDDEPIAYWRCSDPATTLSGVTNTTLRDETRNRYHASAQGSPTYGADGALYDDGDAAVTLNGTSTNYFLVPSGAAKLQELKQSMSAECWFKPAATTGNFGLIENTTSSASNKHWLLFVDGATIYARVVIGSTSYSASYAVPGNLSTSTWYHCVLTYDGTSVRLYVNGTLRATTAAAGGLDTGTYQTYIGRLYDSSYVLNGSLDELAVYDYALSATQVSRHYSVGTTGPIEWRGVPCQLMRYERSSSELVTEVSGVIVDADFSQPNRVAFTMQERDNSKFAQLIPRKIVNVDEHPVGDTVTDVGSPIPAVFGQAIYTAPFVGEDATSNPGGGYFAVGHIEDKDGTAQALRVREVYYDVFSGTAEKDRAGTWATAPGTVTYYDADEFNVTSSAAGRYEVGMPVRFKTTASPSTYVYSYVTNWDTVNYRVRVADAVLDAGLTSVQVNDGFLVDVSTYTINGQPLMTIRTNGAVPDSGVVIEAKNATNTSPADVVRELLGNAEYGLGLSVDDASVDAAYDDLSDVASGVLGEACNYALGGDKQQRSAAEVLREILSIRGMWLEYNATDGEWELYVDKAAANAWRSFGYADGYLENVRGVAYDRRTPLGDMVSSVNLRYGPIGRVKSSTDGAVVFVGSNDSTYSIFGAAHGTGQPLVVVNPWLRGYSAAKEVAAYLGKRLRYEDAQRGLVCGPQARNVALGEAINVRLGPQGFTGTMRVTGYRKRIGECVLECVGYDDNLYADAVAGDLDYEDGSGAETQVDSANDVAEKNYNPRVGMNFVRNAGFSVPPRKVSPGLSFDPTVLPGWFATSDTRVLAVSTTETSGAIGGAYLTASVASGSGGANPYIGINGTMASKWEPRAVPIKQYEVGIFSFYCSAINNLSIDILTYSANAVPQETISPAMIRCDDSSTNPLGWKRYYTIFRSTDADTAYATALFYLTGTSSFSLDAVMFEVAGRGVTKPSTWVPGLDNALMLTKTESVTLSSGATVASGSTNKLLEAGAVIMQVSYKVTTAVTGATTWSLGPTGGTATLYANAFANTVNGTGNAVVNGNGFTPATGVATANTLTFTANGSNFTGGVVSVTVHYYLPGIPT